MNQRTNTTIEKKVLATLVLNADLMVDIAEVVAPMTFSVYQHQQTFDAIETMFMGNIPVSIDSINSQLEKLGIDFNVADIIQHGGGGRDIVKDCLILRELEIARNQIDLGVKLATYGNDQKADPLATNDWLVKETERITSLTDISKPKSNVDLIKANTARMELAAQTKGITGISTGFDELDFVYGGRQCTDLIIKAGRPGMGKTAQALCEAYHMAIDGNHNVAFFSLEMGAEQLMQRLISIHTGIELSVIRSGHLTTEQWNHYNQGVTDLMVYNLTIVDDVYSLNNLRTRCKKMKMQHKLDVVFVDYLQLIVHRVDAGRSKANEVSEISRSLKMMAKDLNVPVVALSQLNRACETRADKKPMLSDLRESGSIEQDADIVEMVYRPEYYSDLKDQDEFGDLDGKAWILIQKNRHGSTRDIEFIFNAECTKFENNQNHDNGPRPF